jgi:SSS family solute:Na+ symporter
LHYLGAFIVLGVIVTVGVSSGRGVKNSKDFIGSARKSGTALVAGALVGTIVGGASTVGTAQLAYTNGLSAWWVTLGGGIGALLLAGLAPRLYNAGVTTGPEIIGREFGPVGASLAAVLSSSGSFMSVVAQLLSGMALITAVSLSVTPASAILIVLLLIGSYVVFGGLLGASQVGMVKAGLVTLSVGCCGVLALNYVGGFGGLLAAPELSPTRYFNFFGRGIGVDLGGCVSLILGVVTEQAYLQALLSAKTVKVSRRGAIVAAVLMPVIGGFGVLVGLSMRVTHPGINSELALPTFILDYLPALPAGMMLATLLITVVGSGAGLSLGIATVLVKDLITPLRKWASRRREHSPAADLARQHSQTTISTLALTRVVLVAVLATATMIAILDWGGLIMNWSFLSMGLRGTVAFGPLLAALFLAGRIRPGFAVTAMVLGPLVTALGAWLLPAGIDPVWLGAGGALAVLALGLVRRH